MADGQAIASVRDQLLRDRHALLDLSTRNRLLNVPLRAARVRTIEIVDERSEETFKSLNAGRAFSFLPGRQLSEAERAELDPDDSETGGIPQPDGATHEGGLAKRHTDLRLQTRLTSEGLQKRLFDIWYDAHTLEEEQGVNVLYLAIGLLRWYDTDTSDVARHAPLLLLPVQLERTSAAEKFKLRARPEPVSANLTLQAKMKGEFSLLIEDLADEDDVDVSAYFAAIAETVRGKSRWEVLPDAMVLGFFSFAKFLMYRDLDPENWPKDAAIDQNALITGLLRDGFPESETVVSTEMDKIDGVIPPLALNHVVDADSSQAVAIEEAANGRTLVVKGPPGTGKSQTITNIIAAAAAKGRKVLFVAEKMAALDVVHRRLKQAGLGALALELHSNKANKRTVLEELRRTRDMAVRPPNGDATVVERLGELTGTLNAHAERLHTALQPSGESPYAVLSRLVATQAAGLPGGFALSGAEAWTPQDVAGRQVAIADLVEQLKRLERTPSEHPWRGVGRDALDPMERARLGELLSTIETALSEAVRSAGEAVEALDMERPERLANFSKVEAALAHVLAQPAGSDRTSLRHALWQEGSPVLQRLVEAGERWIQTRDAAKAHYVDAAWASDLSTVRTAVAVKGGSLFRFLDGSYRESIALLRSYLRDPLPKGQTERIALIDRMIEGQAAQRTYESVRADGAAFGQAWRDESSDWGLLAATVAWRSALPPGLEGSLGRIADLDSVEGLRRLRKDLAAAGKVLETQGPAMVELAGLDLSDALGAATWADVTIDTLATRLDAWRANEESISRYIAYAAKARELAGLGLGSLAAAVQSGQLDGATLPAAFGRGYAEVLRSELFKAWPELRAFDGAAQDRLVEAFCQFDQARIRLAQEHIAAGHALARPKGASGVGPLGVLNGEIAKKRRHYPIRVLLERAGPAIQQLKPVFLMSPLSVAQFLKPGALQFDLLVIDEASQIEPVDALGAIARCRQIVVVGDERQLPPTRFFAKLTSDIDEDEDEETFRSSDVESVLDLCLAKGVPHRMLNWHYRSKHQSLIAVSNRQFYENRLYIVPSPYDQVAGMGLRFHHLPQTVYDRGATRTNPLEAKLVAEAVIRHARDTPNQSLGVATFSTAQRQAILKELELLRRAHPETEGYFAQGGTEPFFVKNLENIQGDERDVIFISLGYGKTKEGQLAHSFGPLNGEGGERRLNVLISRAKLRCEVFANFRGEEIDLERTRAAGVVALKMFMTFAETGRFDVGDAGGREHDSEFEAQVAAKLAGLGYDVKTRIGTAGFQVALAVGDPDKPGRFILGVECDGAQYRAARSARDRNRLRRQVLEAHGWVIHWIWSADWYLRPEEELRKLEAAIAAARADWRERDETGGAGRQAVPLAFETRSIDDDTDQVRAVLGETAAEPAPEVFYDEADFPVDRRHEPHEAPIGEMLGYVLKIVEAEGPIHLDEVATRIRMLWGLQKAGSRIRAAVARAADAALRQGLLVGEEFLATPGQAVVVRNRSQVRSASLRKPEYLPPREIDAALMRVVEENFGAAPDELVTAVARVFGFLSTSAQLRGALETCVETLVTNGDLVLHDGLYVRGG